ncbi:ABC transporter permease [Amphibacillus indicireducens]|uniref:ABC transporter permease n=1 Tax=Amphibacillus indicireducens TaxID=1076330 RepID=A0ABP7V504_9BACI
MQSENQLTKGFNTIHRHRLLRWLQWIIGAPIHLISLILFSFEKKSANYQTLLNEKIEQLKKTDSYRGLIENYQNQYDRKQAYFNRSSNQSAKDKFITAQADQQIKKNAEEALALEGHEQISYLTFFRTLLANKTFIILTIIPGLILYSLCLIYQNVFVRFIFERIVLTFFVIISVIVIVFTILYISPSDAAANILGETATIEQRIEFNYQYGLDQPYLMQLGRAIKGFLTFDLGLSYTGNEVIMTSIANRFPVTLTLAISSLFLAIVIAIPIGMISAAKMNSFWDYSFMFLALIGLSIPSFWQGLIFILTFSIRGNLLPATYSPNNPLSLIMPIVVLGTGLAAAIARMTRASMLEVMHEDYMMTAKAKGLSGREVFLRHGLRNAWIPILTVIGLQFGAMLGGAAVTEQVFNIRGLGSYIVDKQFIPDIPAILAGVVYIAITISLVNLIVDLLYAFLNPRIRSQLKEG